MKNIALLIVAEPAQENIQIKQIESFLVASWPDARLEKFFLNSERASTEIVVWPNIINNFDFSVVYFPDYSDQENHIRIFQKLINNQHSNFIVSINRRKNWEIWLKSGVKTVNPAKLFYEVTASLRNKKSNPQPSQASSA